MTTCAALPAIHSDLSGAFSTSTTVARTMVASSASSPSVANGTDGNTIGGSTGFSSLESQPLIQFLVETPHGRTTTVTRSLDALLSRQLQRQEQRNLEAMNDDDTHGDCDVVVPFCQEDQEADYHDLLLDVLQACQRRDAPQTSGSDAKQLTTTRCYSPAVALDGLSLDDSDCSSGAGTIVTNTNGNNVNNSNSSNNSNNSNNEASLYYMDVDEYIFDERDFDRETGSDGLDDGAFRQTTSCCRTTDRHIHHHQWASPKKRRRRRVLAAHDPRIALVWNGQRVNPTNYYQMIRETVLRNTTHDMLSMVQSSCGGVAATNGASVAAAKKTSSSVTAGSSTTTTTSTRSSSPVIVLPLRLAVGLIVGGIDRQNRVGSKFGGGGVSSSSQSDRERKERLKQLALESIDLAKDPYLMRNHLGTYECKLCLTLHTNEANYLAHTQGKKHQQGLARRAHLEKLREERQNKAVPSATTDATTMSSKKQRIKIGRPAYQVFKSRDPDTNQRCLTFEVAYPEIADGIQPRHRFMSAFEQKVETPPDRRYQYLIFAAEPYETVAFKVPNEPLDRNKFVSHWKDTKFTVTMYYWDKDNDDDKKKQDKKVIKKEEEDSKMEQD